MFTWLHLNVRGVGRIFKSRSNPWLCLGFALAISTLQDGKIVWTDKLCQMIKLSGVKTGQTNHLIFVHLDR